MIKYMDNYFWVKWKDEVIGILARIEGTYYTRFQANHLKNTNLGEEIVKQTTFKPNTLYKNDELFEFFLRRIRLNPGEDVFDRIRKTRAERPTDNFWLEEMNEIQKQQCEKVIKDILKAEENKEGSKNANSRD